jgi:hypothetical protein
MKTAVYNFVLCPNTAYASWLGIRQKTKAEYNAPLCPTPKYLINAYTKNPSRK